MRFYRLFIVLLLGVTVFALCEKKDKEESPPEEIVQEMEPDPLSSTGKLNFDDSITVAPYFSRKGAGAKITFIF